MQSWLPVSIKLMIRQTHLHTVELEECRCRLCGRDWIEPERTWSKIRQKAMPELPAAWGDRFWNRWTFQRSAKRDCWPGVFAGTLSGLPWNTCTSVQLHLWETLQTHPVSSNSLMSGEASSLSDDTLVDLNAILWRTTGCEKWIVTNPSDPTNGKQWSSRSRNSYTRSWDVHRLDTTELLHQPRDGQHGI